MPCCAGKQASPTAPLSREWPVINTGSALFLHSLDTCTPLATVSCHASHQSGPVSLHISSLSLPASIPAPISLLDLCALGYKCPRVGIFRSNSDHCLLALRIPAGFPTPRKEGSCPTPEIILLSLSARPTQAAPMLIPSRRLSSLARSAGTAWRYLPGRITLRRKVCSSAWRPQYKTLSNHNRSASPPSRGEGMRKRRGRKGNVAHPLAGRKPAWKVECIVQIQQKR